MYLYGIVFVVVVESHLKVGLGLTDHARNVRHRYLKEFKIEVQCEGVRSQCVNFHISVYIFRYTEYYIDVRRRTHVSLRYTRSPFTSRYVIAAI